MPVNAASELEFELKYTGEIIKDETKEAKVILRGNNATTYPKVRVKVEVTGPSQPKIMAVDSAGNEIDIAQIGYWGPPGGFPIAGTFENITPIRATFNEVGTYQIKLSLVNVENGETEIISKTETLQVSEKTPTTNETVIEKLPQTGTSVLEYTLYAGIILMIVGFVYYKKS